jgi:hypothetical protein
MKVEKIKKRKRNICVDEAVGDWCKQQRGRGRGKLWC